MNLYGLKTYNEIQSAIKKYLTEHPDAKYVKGRGWSNTNFPKNGPDKKMLDEVVKDIPVSLSSEDGHSKWVNSKTLELAGINNSTKNPDGGIIERYVGTNEPNGTLRESAADLVYDIFPVYNLEELMKGLEKYQEMVLAFGITTVHDAYLDAGSNETEAYRTLEKNDKLKMRFRASLYIDPGKSVEQWGRAQFIRGDSKSRCVTSDKWGLSPFIFAPIHFLSSSRRSRTLTTNSSASP